MSLVPDSLHAIEFVRHRFLQAFIKPFRLAESFQLRRLRLVVGWYGS